MLNSFKSILSNSSEVDVDEMSNDDLLDMRLDSLGIDSQELVQLKEKVTSEVNVFIPGMLLFYFIFFYFLFYFLFLFF